MLNKKLFTIVSYLYILIILIPIVLFLSCSTSTSMIYGNYYSQGEYIIENSNKDGWRRGHYLLTIDSSNTFVLKEVSYSVGSLYTVCSGYMLCQGRNIFELNKIKKDYPYGVCGNPYYNDDQDYKIIIRNNGTIILKKGKWNTILKFITQDSIPKEFDFTKFGYDETIP